jgi:hypothetical protein
MFQICGALAEEGRSLEEIVKIAKNATTKMDSDVKQCHEKLVKITNVMYTERNELK